MRAALLAMIVLALAVAAPPAAAQGTITLRPLGEYVLDKSYFIVVEGGSPTIEFLHSHHIRVTAKVAEGSPDCSLYSVTDDGVLIVGAYPATVTPFMAFIEIPPEVTSPQRLLLCAWLYEGTEWRAGPASMHLDFQPARHELRIAAPRRAQRGRRVSVRFSGTASVKRILLARIARGSKPCGTSDATNRTTRLTQVNDVAPGPINQAARTPRLKRGTYTVCAYLHRQIADPRAEAIARQVIRVR